MMKLTRLIICFLLVVLVGSCASHSKKTKELSLTNAELEELKRSIDLLKNLPNIDTTNIDELFHYSQGVGLLNTDKQKAAKLLMGQWQQVAANKKNGEHALADKMDRYIFRENGKVVLMNTIKRADVIGQYTLLDNENIQITFNDPSNNKPTMRTFNFLVTKYTNSYRLEIIEKDTDSVFSYLRVNKLLCNESLYNGVWSSNDPRHKDFQKIYIFDKSFGYYIHFNTKIEQRVLEGYFSIWRSNNGEVWMSKALYNRHIGNLGLLMGLLIGKINFDGDTLSMQNYLPLVDIGETTGRRLKNELFYKTPFEEIKGEAWWKKILPISSASVNKCER